MVEIICGQKGKGKTKELLNLVNDSLDSLSGNVVYIDKCNQHMLDLNKKIRLIDVSEYPVEDCKEFLGFVCGIVSQDNDLEEVYLDSFLTIAFISNNDEFLYAIDKLDKISTKYKTKFILSVSTDEANLPKTDKIKVLVAL
ncbi:twitching motility protein PilT [Lachnobacterium bovis]|jgi:hypothetical protein|uniref:Twitching motility protein PilT n=1 Tax=Lachnobacterium bovis DSM 14045 TaxID=1122142 RepID=A0A1H3F6B1_9FIRM|nr:twitching motility protein PilT [Lachnobacterium bovis]MBQ1802934.1 twitching motility protein PilT [Lachnobacterium sp.]SDX86511.1 hypothetical protein SAMN02910414_00165 [Lachnobacterium bovis DSM 14045]